jgi:pimeloyl-[acyl-carrier protein] methyl ester esterase
VNLHVERIGHGPDLALLHGWGLHGGIWDPIRASLAERFALHIVDLPGHGFSRNVRADSLVAMANSVEKVLPDGCHICGWSLGGQVAMQIAAIDSVPARKLILAATTPCFVKRSDWDAGIAPEVLDDFAARLTKNYRATLLNFLSLQVLNDAHAQSILHALCDQLFERGDPHPDVLSTGLAILRSSDLRTTIPSLRHAALVVHGERDTLTPPLAGRWLADHLSGARHISFERCAHIPFLSHPQRFVQALCQFADEQ